jgi:hypothetical protein
VGLKGIPVSAIKSKEGGNQMKFKFSGIFIIAVIFLITLCWVNQWAQSQENEPPNTKRRALCVGINNFENYSNEALRGCVADANDMKALLIKWYKFTPENIITLTDRQATKANIMQRLTEMVDGAKKGKYNYIVFSLSTHGTQVLDTSGDEPDGLDEAFCPYDLASAGDFWDPKHIIIDDELYDLFAQVPKNVLVEVFLDTCHSGTGIRVVGIKPRLMPQPSIKARRIVEARSRARRYKPLLDQGKGITNQILWAACKSDQFSNDAEIPRGSGRFNGVFTYYFCETIKEGQNRLPRHEVLRKVRAAVIDGGFYPQQPQLEEYK